VDGSDNFPTRYLVNDACVLLGKPNVYGAIFRFEGQAAVFDARRGPCYRCLYAEPPPPELVPSCAEGGVLGVLPGIVGSIQGMEAIKLLLGVGEPLVGRLLLVEGLTMRFRELAVRKDPECPVCGSHPTVTGLIDYEAFCGYGEGDADGDAAEIGVGSWRAARTRPAVRCLDVRSRSSGRSRIAGATHVPLGELAARLGELDGHRESWRTATAAACGRLRAADTGWARRITLGGLAGAGSTGARGGARDGVV
jgi:adenylyltransferase/sulfurtransferase